MKHYFMIRLSGEWCLYQLTGLIFICLPNLCFRLQESHANYTEIDLSFTYKYTNKVREYITSIEWNKFEQLRVSYHTRADICRMQLSSAVMQDFMK